MSRSLYIIESAPTEVMYQKQMLLLSQDDADRLHQEFPELIVRKATSHESCEQVGEVARVTMP